MLITEKENDLTDGIATVLDRTRQSVEEQIQTIVKAVDQALLSKDDTSPTAQERAKASAERIDLGSMTGIIDATEADIAAIAADSGQLAIAQVGEATNSGLVNQIYQASLDFAKQRAAEMVGRKWVNGELVDNPDAKWVITDSTRDELETIFEQLYSGQLKRSDLIQAIRDAGAFSKVRAAMIARTEASLANNAGALAGYLASRDLGLKIRKTWVPDNIACPICLANGDQGAIELDDNFLSGNIAPPAHPNCRCNLAPVVDD